MKLTSLCAYYFYFSPVFKSLCCNWCSSWHCSNSHVDPPITHFTYSVWNYLTFIHKHEKINKKNPFFRPRSVEVMQLNDVGGGLPSVQSSAHAVIYVRSACVYNYFCIGEHSARWALPQHWSDCAKLLSWKSFTLMIQLWSWLQSRCTALPVSSCILMKCMIVGASLIR